MTDTITMREAAKVLGWRYERVRQRCLPDHPDPIPSYADPTRAVNRGPQMRRRIPVDAFDVWRKERGL